MHNPNAVVEPVVTTITLHRRIDGGATLVRVVAQCAVTVNGLTQARNLPLTVDVQIDADKEIGAQVELLESLLRRRLGLDYGEA